MKFRNGSVSLFSIFLVVVGLSMSGCAISQKVYVQDAVVTAPAVHLPVRVADDVVPGQLTITPTLAISRSTTMSGRIDGHSKVSSVGLYAVDTIHNNDGTVAFSPGSNSKTFSGTNLQWSTARYTTGLDLDWPLSHSFALSGGFLYSGGGNGDGAWGGHLGFGFMGGGKNVGVRFDAGLLWTPGWYDVKSVVETQVSTLFGSSYVRSAFYEDEGESSGLGWYGSLTLNVKNPEWDVRPFLNITAAKQCLYSVTPHTPLSFLTVTESVTGFGTENVKGMVTTFSMAPGMSVPIGPSQRVLLGVRWVFAPDLFNDGNTSISAGNQVMPFIQVDIGL